MAGEDTEARALIASARALVEELAEEGVDRYERPDPETPAPARRDPQPAALPGLGAAPREPEASLPLEPDTPPWGERPDLEAVRRELGECTRCALAAGRTQIVFGDGNPHADLMFIGEGPGQEEDRRGLPFVGRAGELLTQMIEKGLGIPRSEVYICNIVKCRPPNNRTPLDGEVAACRPFLEGQIAAIRPKVIVALGRPAASALLGRNVAITKLRGTWHSFAGIPLMPTLHPAYVLRQYTPENRRNVWQDLKAALEKSRET
jgi:uracil-DNA glycosylase family 4